MSVFFLILCGEFELCFQRDLFVVRSLVGGQKKSFMRDFKKQLFATVEGKMGGG